MEKKKGLSPEQALWAANLKRLWLARKQKVGKLLTQEMAASRFGWTQSAIGQYLNAKIPLNTDAKLKFASLLECSIQDIDPAFPVAKVGPATAANDFPMPLRIPHLDWADARLGGTPEASKAAKNWRFEANIGQRSFALTLLGDSMSGGATPILPNSVVVIDPDKSIDDPLTNVPPIVLVELPDGNIALRQITHDGATRYLKANVDGYPRIPLNEARRIIGVVRRVAYEY